MSIEIRGLTITIGDKPIVRDACMDIADGERIGLVGSSGSGKSMIAKALMGLLPDTARVSGSIMAGGRQLIGLDDTAMADLRGRYMGHGVPESGGSAQSRDDGCTADRSAAVPALRSVA